MGIICPQDCTHLGVPLSNLVTLSGSAFAPDGDRIEFFSRIFPDGSVEVFEIPENQALIVTDITYAFSTGNVPAGNRVFLSIFQAAFPFELIFQTATETVDNTEVARRGGGTINLTSGLAFTTPFTINFSDFLSSVTVTLNGYFIDIS